MPDKNTKIVFLDAASVGEVDNFDSISSQGEYIAYPNTKPEETVKRLQGAQVAITNKVNIKAEALAKLPDLKLICVAATGMNNIDIEAANARGIEVKNVAAYSTQAVAQSTMAFLFALAMDLVHLSESVYDGTYKRAGRFSYWRYPFYELAGARFGIIGMGAIGQSVAKLATAYGAKVVYYSTSGQNREQPYPCVSLEELLETCEVISIHAPLNENTHNLITYKELSDMKSSAYLINVGRGGIVNEGDLARAIDDELIAGAAVDVFTQEPIPEDHPYMSVKNKHRLLLTPHVAWASVESRTALIEGVANNIRNWKKNR